MDPLSLISEGALPKTTSPLIQKFVTDSGTSSRMLILTNRTISMAWVPGKGPDIVVRYQVRCNTSRRYGPKLRNFVAVKEWRKKSPPAIAGIKQ